MAARVWVGGSGNWNDTAHWSTASGGSGGSTVPGSGDAATVDAHALGLNGGTLTVDVDINAASLSIGTMVGTMDFGSHNVALNTNPFFSNTGSGARTITTTGGTWTITGAAGTLNLINCSTTTGLTNPTTALSAVTFSLTNTSTVPALITCGGLTYGPMSFQAHANKGGFQIVSSANTFASISISAPNKLTFPSGVTTNVTAAMALVGTAANPISIMSSNPAVAATINTTSGTATLTWGSLCSLAGTGGATWTATNAIDALGNSGWTITSPSSGGSSGVIGG